ncbi:MAG TPA: hypothetical protein VHC19_09330 [Pirellulales bacterium]|nr:hypothetical protein [Pirellulales bacterium]
MFFDPAEEAFDQAAGGRVAGRPVQQADVQRGACQRERLGMINLGVIVRLGGDWAATESGTLAAYFRQLKCDVAEVINGEWDFHSLRSSPKGRRSPLACITPPFPTLQAGRSSRFDIFLIARALDGKAEAHLIALACGPCAVDVAGFNRRLLHRVVFP